MPIKPPPVSHASPRISRRDAMGLAGAGVALATLASSPVSAQTPAGPRLKAIVFDGFAVFDTQPVVAAAERLFPGRGVALAAQWRTKIFEYTWLRVAGGHYADFEACVNDALTFTAKSLGLDLTPVQHEQLSSIYADLRAYDDMPSGLMRLKAAGVRLAVLANATPAMLDKAVRNSALETMFEDVISTDRVKSYKPDPRAYRLAPISLHLLPTEIGFVASASWDSTGAAWFGYEAFWLDRFALPPEQLGGSIEATCATMNDLAPILLSRV